VGAREAAVEVLTVLRDDESAARTKRRDAHDRYGRDASPERHRVEGVHEADDRCDRRVLAAVDPAKQAQVRAVTRACGLEARQLEAREQLVVEADGAPLDHPASLASTSTSGT
jgi:hypothetical protein